MSNFQFGYNFVDYTPTASSENSPNYLDDNLKKYGNLRDHWRSLVATEVTIVFNFGSAKNIIGNLLADINFTACYIQANSVDVWTSPPYRYPASGNLTVSKDERTQRYNLWIPPSFNYQYQRLVIPAQTPVDGLGIFRMGTFVALNTILTLTDNPSWPYQYSASKLYRVNEFESGRKEKIKLCDYKIWQGLFSFDPKEKIHESELWTMDSIDEDDYLVFFENNDNTSQAYICQREGSLEVEWDRYATIKTNKYLFEEIV